MLELLLFNDSEKAVEYFKKFPDKIEGAFSDVAVPRRFITDNYETEDIIVAFDTMGLHYKNSVDAMLKLAQIDVRLLQVKYYLELCAANHFHETEKLTWEI